MPDREKVIKVLSDALTAKENYPWVKAEMSFEFIEMLLELLKEQEAVEPKPVHNSFRWFACGKCDCSITREDRFCPRCGRQVKWDA